MSDEMKVWVALDSKSRWFELFQKEESAQARADKLNEQFKTTRYSIAHVEVQP